MRTIIVGLVLSLLAVALVGCSTTGAPATQLALGAAPWKDGERLAYDWQDKNGNKIGTAEVAFAREGNAWLLTHVDKLPNLDQTVRVRLDVTSLRPLGAEKTIKAQGTDARISTSYEGGKLNVKATVNGEDKAASVDVPANILENDQLLQTLRALTFADNYEGKFVNVVGQNAAKIDTTVRVKGKERLQLPAGAFDTWKVELDFGQAKQYAWYRVDAPNTLVQYDNGQTKLVLTLP